MKYQIGPIVVDSDRFCISDHGENIHVEPKVFDLLVFLLQQRHRVTSRDELLENVWKNQFVSDATLSNHISHLRQIFNDDGKTQHTIKTVQRRGYQFIAAVTESTPTPASKFSPNKRLIYLGSSAITLCLIIAIMMLKSSDSHTDQYQRYQQAEQAYSQYTQDSLAQAEQLTRALLKDAPEFAQAWFLLSKITYRKSVHLHNDNASNGLAISEQFAMKAIALKSDYALAHAHLATIHLSQNKFLQAEESMQLALANQDDNQELLTMAASYAIDSGQLRLAQELYQQVIAADPLTGTNYYNLALAFLWDDQAGEAEEALRKYAYLNPDAQIHNATLCAIYLQQGRFEQAHQQIIEETNPFWQLLGLNYTFYALGLYQNADKALAEFIDQFKHSNPTTLASIYAFRNEADDAFLWLEKALAEDDPRLVNRINFTPFRNLHNDARWQPFIEKLNLPPKHWLHQQLD